MLSDTSGQAQELKAEGALEASRDPASNVDARAAEDEMMAQSRQAGVSAFEFDPDASPEEKKAQMKAHAQVERPHRKHQVAVLASDQDDGQTAGYDLRDSGKAGAISTAEEEGKDADGSVSKDSGDVYAKTGWAPRFGNPSDKDEEGTLLDHQDMLEGKLDDKFFGDWYHNAGVIVFACLSSWVVAVLGGGLGWVLMIMAACGTYYRTSLRRVRRNFRDDVTREMAKARLETDTESLEWMNSFLVKFWPIYAPVLCATIISSVDQVLSTTTPAFLDSMRMKFFTLGTKPPRMEHVKTYPKADDDTVLMDWKFSFTPNDVADLTARQIKNKINPKVVLEIRVGKAMISKGMDIIVEDMACSGIMRVKVKLQLAFPHIDRVEICFLGKPQFDYACKPIGGDMLGFDINFIPGLESFIQEQIHANLAPMMYSPNVFPIEIAKMLAGNPVDQAIGVLQVTFHGAHGLKNPDKFSGTPDPYAVVSINHREALGKTKTVPESASPRWNETVNVILTSLREPLTIQVYDYNEYRKDKELGVCSFNLEQLETEDAFENQQLEVIANGRARGVVQADIRFFPVLEGNKLQDGTEEPPPESATGIAKFTVEQAKDLDGTKSLIGQLNPYAVLLLNGKEVQISQKLKRTNNPIWPDASKELLITNRKKAKLGLVIKDDRDLAADPILGSYQIKLDDMLELMSKGQEWYHLGGAKTGRAKMSMQWKPVALKGAVGGSGYVTPIGVMRIHFKSAKELKNLETLGKSDPYIRVLLSGIQKRRTVTWKNTLNPEFDEIFYVPVHSAREKLTIECMDEENLGKDRTLGQLEVLASEYVRQGENGEYMVHDSRNDEIKTQLRIGNSPPKGTLHYTIAFFPTLNVVDPEEEEEEEKENANRDAGRTSMDSKTNGLSAPRHARSNTAGTIGTIGSTSTVKSTEQNLEKVLARGEKDQTEADEVKLQEVPKVRIGVEDLPSYESGILIFKIIEGQFAHADTYLEVVMDDHLFPAYSTNKIRSTSHTFNEISDAMVRELDLSRITLRLVSAMDKKGEGDEDIVEAKIAEHTMETLKRCLYTPTEIPLRDQQGRISKVKVSMRFLPVKMELDPSESFNNAGNLRVEVLDAADLPAADRNGFSDPYCKFVHHGEEIYKTKTQKKTLHPAWNEFFELSIRSRTASDFRVDVYDWDFADKADWLGSAHIPLDVLEPFQAQEVTLNLDGKSGALRLKMLFKPDYVTRTRQGSSTFSGTFSAPGKIIGAPVKGATFLGGAAVGGVSKGAGFFGRAFKRVTSAGEERGEPSDAPGGIQEVRDTSMDVPPGPGAQNGHVSQSSVGGASEKPQSPKTPQTPHNRAPSFGTAAQPGAAGAESGIATISVVSASGFPADTKLEVRILHDSHKGLKDIIKTKTAKAKTGEASFEGEKQVPCAADHQFRVMVSDQHTFSSDDLGEAAFFVNDQAAGGTQNVRVGNGVVKIRSSFAPTSDGASSVGRPSSAIPDSPASGRHKQFGRLSKAPKDRSVTPSG